MVFVGAAVRARVSLSLRAQRSNPSCRHTDMVMPRECGASRTLGPIVSISWCAWRWDHSPPPVIRQTYDFAFSRRSARGLHIRWPSEKLGGRREDRVRAAPAVSRALRRRTRTRAYRFSGEHPAFPAQWLYGLYRDLPGETRSIATIARSSFAAANLTPASGARTTRLRRTFEPRSSVAALASTASHRAFVTIAIRPSHRVRRAKSSH